MNEKENFYPLLAIGGSDNSGGAGIQADLKTFQAFGCYGLSAITAVTAQSFQKFIGYEIISPELIEEQIAMSIDQANPVGVKTGMLADGINAKVVSRSIEKFHLKNLVIDPVLQSSTGRNLNENANDFIRALKDHLIPLSLVITPNRREAEILSGRKISSYGDIEKCSEILLSLGPEYVIIKGGHMDFDSNESADVLISKDKIQKFSQKRLKMGEFHGTGCTYASAFLSAMTKGFSMEDSVKTAMKFIYEAMRQSDPLNPGVLNHSCRFQT